MKLFRILFLGIFQMIVTNVFSQGVPLHLIDDVQIDGKNVYASTHPRLAEKDKKTNQDILCGLLIVKSTIKGLSFPEAVGTVKYEDSKYYVYLKPKTKKATVVSGNNKLKLKIDGGVDSKVTYDATVVQKEVYGSLSIKAKPVKVDVFLNGKSIGTTPLERYQLYPGDYKVRLSAPGYVDEEFNIEIAPNKNSSSSIELMAAPDYKALYNKYRKNR